MPCVLSNRFIKNNTVPTAAPEITNATMASTLSNTPTVAGGLGADALAGAAVVPGLAAVAGAAALGGDVEDSLAPGAAVAGRAAVAAAAAGAAVAGLAAGGAAPAGAAGTETAGAEGATPGAPEAGSVGSLMVGEAVGLGGSAMRTVSFLG